MGFISKQIYSIALKYTIKPTYNYSIHGLCYTIVKMGLSENRVYSQL